MKSIAKTYVIQFFLILGIAVTLNDLVHALFGPSVINSFQGGTKYITCLLIAAANTYFINRAEKGKSGS